MANPYAYNVITFDGAALIAQATAANPIVYVDALSKATAAESDADLASKPVSWYDGKAGSISAVSAAGNVARVIAVWGNAGSPQAAKALAITARLASQADSQAVVVAAMADPDSTIILPGADDVQGGVEVPFNVAFNAAGDVQVTPGASASVADLARFVSLHKAGDPTQGEAQTVLGEKSFADGLACTSISGIGEDTIHIASPISGSGGGPISLASSLLPGSSSVKLGASDAMISEVFAYSIVSAYDASHGVCATSGETESIGSTYRINWYSQSNHKGLEAKVYLSTEEENSAAKKETAGIRLRDGSTTKSQMELAYSKAQDSGTASCVAKAGTGTEAAMKLDASPNDPKFSVDLTQENGDLAAGLRLTKDFGLYLESDTGPTRIGKASSPIGYVSAYNFGAKDNVSLYTTNSNDTTSAKINMQSDATDDPQITAELTDSNELTLARAGLYVDNSKSYLSMYSDLYETCIGHPNNKVSHIYAVDLQGIIPHPESAAEPPVGTTFFGAVLYSGSITTPTVGFGQLLKVGSASVILITAASWSTANNGFEASALGNFSTGKYRALSLGSAPGGSYCFVQLIRVE